jgi:hypothetical protein
VNTRFLTYEEWLKEHPELADVECEECDGSGVTECWYCNDPHICKACEGTGKAARKIYREQLKRDKRNLETWPLAGQQGDNRGR